MRLFFKIVCAGMCVGAVFATAQSSGSDAQELARVSLELRQTRAELADSQKQIEELRRGLDQLRSQVNGATTSETALAPQPSTASADQDPGFLAAKIGELHQDKVESASKYPVKLSGLVLFNAYSNRGDLDIQDLPNLAFPKFPGSSNGSFGATFRQTLLGVEVAGPTLFGAQTSADVEVDFAGGSPTTAFGVSTGLLRLRTAKVELRWKNTALNAGQDALFFSPLSPTSYATLIEPALSWSGNLWVWTPQVEIEHRVAVSHDSSIMLQGGVLDPLTEEIPSFQGRVPTAGEASRVPAMAGRIAFDRATATHLPWTIGFGGYRAQQQYELFPAVGSWSLNADVKVPLGEYFEVSGEGYYGQAVGGLGGGIWTSVVYPEASGPHTAIHPLRSAGEWAQFKIKPMTQFEINAVLGQDENRGEDLRFFPTPFAGGGFAPLQKNRTELLNVIYKPSSVLLFAIEYRHLFTAPASGQSASGDQFNLAAGVKF